MNRIQTEEEQENECKMNRGKELKTFTDLLLESSDAFFRPLSASSSSQTFPLLVEISEQKNEMSQRKIKGIGGWLVNKDLCGGRGEGSRIKRPK